MNRRFPLRSRPLAFALAASLFSPALLTHASAQNANAQEATAQEATPVKGEFLVRWAAQSVPRVLAPGVDPSPWQQKSLSAQVSAKLPGASVARTFSGSGWSLIRVPVGQSGAASARLSQALGAANITYNYRRQIAKIPNDPEYGTQWHWPQIKAAEAWNLSTGDSKVVVAVLDTGVDLTHADLKANLWKNPKETAGNKKDDDKNGYVDDVYGYNAIDPTKSPQDDNGHGTHCAGLIGATGNNKTNIVGASWNVKIMALKFLDGAGAGEDANAIACIEYAVKMKKSGVNLRVISNSWSGKDDNPALKAAFQLAESAGILNVCASGNGNNMGGSGYNADSTPQYPASYTLNSIVSIAASDEKDALASFSNYGAKSVDLAAPGTAILSLRNGGGTRTDSGTSMATPIVAGAAALIAMKEPALSATQIKARLLATVDPVAALKGKVVSGGRLNLYRAVSNATLNISGQAYRLSGTTRVALAGVQIQLKGKTLLSTGTDGKYVLSDITPGTYQVTALLKGYTFTALTLVLPRSSGTGAPNGIADFPVKTAPTATYTLSGLATNASNQPQKGISIFVSGTPNAVATTGSDGKYVIRDRAAATYKLTATGGDVVWTPNPVSVVVPAKTGTTGAPNGIVNFSASVPDAKAPALTIVTPKNGATLTLGAATATGTATDASGTTQIYLQLNRIIGFDFAYYDWTNKVWTSDSEAAGTTLTKTVSGTSLSWSQALPTLVAGNYTLRAWGKDALGNESRGEADESSSFTVASSIKSTQKAQTSTTPSANSS